MCNVTSGCETKPFFDPVSPIFFIFLFFYKDYTTIQSCNIVWEGVGGVVCCLLCCLSILHLLANLVAQDLVPVDLGACHRKLAA